MKTHILLHMVVVAFTGRAFGQIDLLTIGTFDDIKGLTKLCVVADNESRKAILKVLKRQQAFSLVDKPDDAEFFIEHKTIPRQPFAMMGTTDTWQLDAYVHRDGKKVVV